MTTASALDTGWKAAGWFFFWYVLSIQDYEQNIFLFDLC